MPTYKGRVLTDPEEIARLEAEMVGLERFIAVEINATGGMFDTRAGESPRPFTTCAYCTVHQEHPPDGRCRSCSAPLPY